MGILRSVLKVVGVCLMVSLMAPTVSNLRGVRANGRPNILFITLDDLNVNLGCYGHPLVKSPNIDRLAREGSLFEKAYCQFPLCNPSRTSFLSGKRPESTGVLDNKTKPRTNLPDHRFLPEYFGDRGYFTGRVGKILHDPFQKAVRWDIAKNPADDSEENVVRPPGGLREWEASPLGDDKLVDGRITRLVLRLIRENANEPFFIAAGFRRPHRPYIAPKRFFDMYDLDDIELPEEASHDDVATVEQKKEVVRAYYACISYVDYQIGLILNELDRLGIRDKTIIVFLSDHGADQGERNRFGRKRSLNEQILRVPLIFAGPGIPQGQVFNHLVELVDLYPTLSALCNYGVPDGMEGLSMVPILTSPTNPWKTAAFTENEAAERSGKSVRTDRYRYTRLESGEDFLYDISQDPDERDNLVEDPSRAATLQEMRKLLIDGWRSVLPSANKKR
jgi:uncharacterized sulfatase